MTQFYLDIFRAFGPFLLRKLLNSVIAFYIKDFELFLL